MEITNGIRDEGREEEDQMGQVGVVRSACEYGERYRGDVVDAGWDEEDPFYQSFLKDLFLNVHLTAVYSENKLKVFN